MLQLEYYPNRDQYRLFDKWSVLWFYAFDEVKQYLVDNRLYVRTKTLSNTDKRLLAKAGVKVYALNN